MSSVIAMPQAPLGDSGLLLSRVGLGTWAMGGPWERGWGEQDDAQSAAAIRRAVEGGATWIDTAAVYGHGHAETMIGAVVRDFPEADRPLVFTKCGRKATPEGIRSVGDPRSITAEAEASLGRLGVEQLDLLQLHWPPADGTSLEDAWAALAALKQNGTTRFIGACNVSTEELRRLEAVAHVDLIQPPLSLIRRDALDDSLAWALASGTGAIVYSPLQSGLLSGGFNRERVAALDDGDWRKADAEFTEPKLSRNLALVEQVTSLAAQAGCTVAELAIAWTLEQPGVTAAIVGARRPSQVEGWIDAARVVLDGSTRSALAAMIDAPA
jgi:aryl-alcohol dehydrogenase-like predicted oxidoreductase